MLGIYLGVFVSTFLAATFLPVPSEVTVLAAAAHDKISLPLLWLVASVGNTLGAVANWCLGRFAITLQDLRWWPANPSQMRRAETWFSRYGLWTLLFAWLPIVGDPLTLIAGVLRVPLPMFVLLVGLGKALRFAIVVGLLGGLLES